MFDDSRPEEDRLTVGLVSLEADPPRLDRRDQILTEASFLFWEPVEFLNSFENDANRVERINGGGVCLMIVAEDRGHVIDTLTADGTKQRASATAPPWHSVSLSCAGSGARRRAPLDFARWWSRVQTLGRIEPTTHATNEREIAVFERRASK